MSKLGRQVAVKFRRNNLREGDTVEVVSVPESPMTDGERDAIKRAIGSTFVVIDGDEHGAIIQLHDYFAPTWIDIDSLKRTL